MVGKVNLYVPGEDEAAAAASAAYAKIAEKVEIQGAFKYSSEKEAVKFASKAAAAGETCIIAVDKKRFCNVKLLLLKVLSVKVLRSDIIAEKMGNSIPEKSGEYKIQAAMPDGGTVYPCENGQYSAFSYKCADGSVILLPMEEELLCQVIASGALDGTAAPKSSKEILTDNLSSIAKAGKTVAVAETGLSKAILTVAETVGTPARVLKSAAAQTELAPENDEYIAEIAKSARENGKCDFGVAISDIASDGTIKVCVADKLGAKVAVVHSLEGEDRSQHARAATEQLSAMLAECVKSGINPPKRRAVKNNTMPLIIVIICLCIASAACLTVGAVIYKKTISQAKTASASTTAQVIIPSTDESYDGEEFGEVVPNFDDSSEESSKLEVIDTTFNGGGISSNAENGQYTTNSSGIFETAATSVSKTTTQAVTTVFSLLGNLRSETDDEEKGEDKTSTTEATTESEQGKFVFTVYGYGHGVGMSQRGAMALANKGWNCNRILCHYYQGVTLMVDKNTPAEITKGGQKMTLVAFLCRTVKKEMGQNSPIEALKAQAIAAYTFAMYNSFDGQQAFDPSYDYKGSAVEQAVFSVLHITSEDEQPHATFVSYNGSYANCVYFASAAGKTTSAQSVWGSSKLPYLSGGCSSDEKIEVTTREYTVSQMRRLIKAYGGDVKFDSNPYNWIKIISHDGAYGNAVGYVDEINVCGMSMSGNAFREKLLGRSIKSHCFTIKYIKYS